MPPNGLDFGGKTINIGSIFHAGERKTVNVLIL
jgi:hypothetical protein